MAEPQVARAGRKWCTGRGHAAGGHATTRVHVGARVGRHVAGKDGSRRAYGYSGTLVREGDGNAINSHLRPPYLSALFPNIFSVWDYVPTRFYDAGDIAASHASHSS